MRWRPAFWLVAAGVVVADLATKQWALSTLTPYEVHPLLGDWLGIQLVFNSGAAFSLGNAFTWVLTLLALAVTVGIIVYARRARSALAVVIFGAALGGAVGNLVDRLFREPSFGQGHVVDMIKYGDFFVGNVADIAIVGAGIALVVASMFGAHLLAPEKGDAEAGSGAADQLEASPAAETDADAENDAEAPSAPDESDARG